MLARAGRRWRDFGQTSVLTTVPVQQFIDSIQDPYPLGALR
jgi:hypothetical protein